MDGKLSLETAEGWAIEPHANGKVTAVVFKMKDGVIGAMLGNQDFGRYASRIILEAQKFAATQATPAPQGEILNADPIPLAALGIGRGRTSTEALLSAKLGNLTLVFSVELSMLRELCTALLPKLQETGPGTSH
jgi:hypothetical protein